MTTPRVYSVAKHDLMDFEKGDELNPVGFRAVILLSDHKEVVRRLEDALKSHPHSGSRLEDYMKIDDLEALVKRQAIAIEKLKEQRDHYADIAHEHYSIRLLVADDAEIAAILQEAK